LNLAHRVTEEARRVAAPVRRTASVAAADRGGGHPFANFVVLLSPPTSTDDVAERLAGFYPDDRPFVLFSAWPTPDLRVNGLMLMGHPPFMVRLPGPPPEGRFPMPGVDVRPVATAEEQAIWERVLIEGYPVPELTPGEPGGMGDPRLVGDGGHRVIAWVEGRPVAVAAGHVDSGVNQVEFVATLPAERGRGYGEAATWSASLVDPSLPAVLVASDLGRGVYERMGYVAVTRWTLWARLPS
jgi:hypothetical protein